MAGRPERPPAVPVCPHCGGALQAHGPANPHTAGAWHCNGCGGCWRDGAPRAGHLPPVGWEA